MTTKDAATQRFGGTDWGVDDWVAVADTPEDIGEPVEASAAGLPPWQIISPAR